MYACREIITTQILKKTDPQIIQKTDPSWVIQPYPLLIFTRIPSTKLSLVPVLISEKDSVNLNELQGHVNNWREIICDFSKEGFHAANKKYRHLADTTKSAI
jgi:hypothetical protein